jgi:citrate lyase subunit beta/citryl-CoA lyase
MREILLRNMMYVPAYREKFIEKSLTAPADAIIYDLEDSVPQEFKPDARKILKEYIDKGVFKDKTVFVRLNPLESNMLSEDLKYVLHRDITGFMPSKIYTAADMDYYDKLITQLEAENGIETGHFKFTPLIETTSAVMDIYNICKQSKRTIAVCFGGEDFLNDLEGLHKEPPRSFDYPRAAIAIAARASGIQPIDTPYLAIHNEEGFIKEENISFEIGFSGVQILSPRQIPLANRCFTPDEEEVKRSEEIMEACRLSALEGSGVAMYKDKMIGPPMRKRAEKVLEIMELIRNNEK